MIDCISRRFYDMASFSRNLCDGTHSNEDYEGLISIVTSTIMRFFEIQLFGHLQRVAHSILSEPREEDILDFLRVLSFTRADVNSVVEQLPNVRLKS